MRQNQFRDEDIDPGRLYKYIVTGKEYSGLEGIPSNEVVIAPAGRTTVPYQLHYEAELALLAPPAREAFDGWCSGFHYVRMRKELETEKTSSIRFIVSPQFSSDYNLWLRTRATDKPGKWAVTLDYKPLGELSADGPEWRWVRFSRTVPLEATRTRNLIIYSSEEGLALDKIILTNQKNYVPETLDDRFRTPPRKLKYLVATEATESSVRLAWWNPQAEPDLERYDIYVSETPDFPP